MTNKIVFILLTVTFLNCTPKSKKETDRIIELREVVISRCCNDVHLAANTIGISFIITSPEAMRIPLNSKLLLTDGCEKLPHDMKFFSRRDTLKCTLDSQQVKDGVFLAYFTLPGWVHGVSMEDVVQHYECLWSAKADILLCSPNEEIKKVTKHDKTNIKFIIDDKFIADSLELKTLF